MKTALSLLVRVLVAGVLVYFANRYLNEPKPDGPPKQFIHGKSVIREHFSNDL